MSDATSSQAIDQFADPEFEAHKQRLADVAAKRITIPEDVREILSQARQFKRRHMDRGVELNSLIRDAEEEFFSP